MKHQVWRSIAAALVVVGMTATALPAVAAERLMIVLDASGSMWGQIDGEPKISIARRVLRDVLATTPGDLELGLMTYGHREKGQCSDIELLVAPAAGTAGAIGDAADGLNPLGKTPLAASVRQAAEALRFTEDKATVLVVTDGIETCEADPCALAAELAQQGIDFTAHVVGFGLSAEEGQQVACLAEETGGLYVSADDAETLSDALTDRVTEVAEVVEEEPEPAPEVLPEASLDAPETVEIGKRFTTAWEGPGERRDAIVLVDPSIDGESRQQVAYRRLANGDVDAQTIDTVAPVRPGTYELRYVWRNERIVLATRTIEVIDAPVSLDAPATVEISRSFTVTWEGPGSNRDTIEIIDPLGGPDGARVRGKRLVNDDYEARQVTLEAPAEPGFYRLQYWNGDNREVLATREIEVLEAETSLTAPAEVAMGTSFAVEWVGPGHNRDSVRILDGSGKEVAGKRLVNDDYRNRTVTLIAPATPGSYTLEYYNGVNRTALAAVPMEVVAMDVALDAPDSVVMGHVVTVNWIGPGARRDAIEIFDPEAEAGRGKVVASLRIVNGDFDARQVQMSVPVRTGTYELRYWNGDSREVLATRPITIEPMDVSVSAPASVAAGEPFEATWAGPGARRDSVQVFDPEAQAGRGKDVGSTRVVNGDYDGKSVRIRAPKEPGTYLLRYWSGEWNTALAEVPISVE